MITLRGRQYSFQKVTQLPQGNIAQVATASNTLYCSITYICSGFLLKRVFFIKLMILLLQNTFSSQVFFVQANSVLQINNVLDSPVSSIDGFLYKRQYASSFHFSEAILHKGDVPYT
jgi:hypothetical protein